MTSLLFAFLAAAAAAAVLTPAAARLGLRFGVLDLPDARKRHQSPVPRTGGWAVFPATAAVLAGGLPGSRETAGLLLGGTLIFLVGALDDARGLSATVRLAAQVVAALIVAAFGTRLTFVPHVPGEALWETLLTVAWMVGVTNAVNFLDGVDGLAGSLGVLCALLFAMLTGLTGQWAAARYALALAGGCLGFLPCNWRPARVFLGDGGSTFIGFSLAGLAVMGSWASDQPVVALSTPLLVLSVPIFDMVYTTVSRVKNGQVRTVKQWIEFTGRDHFHHRLLNIGLTETQTVGFIFLVNLCLGVAALTLREAAAPLDAALLLVQAFLIFIIITVLMLLGRRAAA